MLQTTQLRAWTTLDQRLEGNRAPFMLGMHTDEYSSKFSAETKATNRERQEAVEEFVEYAISKPEVRFVPYRSILDWMRWPVPLED